MPKTTFVIAEAGVNHNGDPDLAFKLIDAAISSGANAVKFQTFKAENLVTSSAEKANYQKVNTDCTESQLQMLKRLELPLKSQIEMAIYCREQGIQFLSTAFDFESLSFLVDEIGVEILKIPSGELTNGPFILAHAHTERDIILSTGMANLDEIRTALSVLAFGYMKGTSPTQTLLNDALISEEGRQLLRDKVKLLHCTTEYPAPMIDINLRAMDTMEQEFGLPIGYSDHSEGIAIPIAAVALGAEIIEKHFTLDRNLPGPDHKASLEPKELKDMVRAIRDVEVSLGDGNKMPRAGELTNRDVVRKSIVAKQPIKKKEPFTEQNIVTKRPGTGMSPMQYWSILGVPSNRDYEVDDQIEVD